METTPEQRWQERFELWKKLIVRLNDAAELNEYTDLERSGLIHVFEFVLELAWKTLKDRLYSEGFVVKSPREAIKTAFQIGLIADSDGATWMEMLDKRNLLAHTYSEEEEEHAVESITEQFLPCFQRLQQRLEQDVV